MTTDTTTTLPTISVGTSHSGTVLVSIAYNPSTSYRDEAAASALVDELDADPTWADTTVTTVAYAFHGMVMVLDYDGDLSDLRYDLARCFDAIR